ncbi:MAG: hypothetical protein R3282_09280 [Rhodothermales bacterium]|nr:hypothetical protein [Rhodothermales bacterium]
MKAGVCIAAIMLASVSDAGCGVFGTRDPEPPITGGGTYRQPDTAEQVVSNLQSAVEELNTLNYRRSFSDGFEFTPTSTAEANNPIWSGWSVTNEEQYFSALSSAAQFSVGHELVLDNASPVPVSERMSVVDSGYTLTINHNRPDIATEFAGQLRWEIEQGDDGLWRLIRWTDRELGSNPSWSDLKAEFVD